VLISVRHANLAYKNQLVFTDLNLDFIAGQWTCLLGASGVGKTSLLRLIAGLSEKRRQAHTQVCAEIHSQELKSLQGNVSFMSQQDSLMPWLSVLDNVLICKRLEGQDIRLFKDRAIALLHKVGLDAYVHQRPAELSGGMRQRVALAQTLLANKPIVLLDEPFSALDAITRYNLQNLAAECLYGRTVIMVTHDPMEALRLGHQIKILAGSPAKLVEEVNLPSANPREVDGEDISSLYKHILELLKLYHFARSPCYE